MVAATPFRRASFTPRAAMGAPGLDRARGFTIIEMMLVILIAAILIIVGIPSFRDLIIATRIKNASFDVFSSLIQTRSEALTRNTTVTMAPVSGNWANGWTITESGGTVVRKEDAVPNITIAGPASVTFNGMGRLTAAVNPFDLSATGASATSKRCVKLDLSGRPVSSTGACT